MKRPKTKYLAYQLVILLALLATSCKNKDVAMFMLNENNKYLSIGDSLQLGYMKVEPEDKDYTVTWASSNNIVATVNDKGLVIAKAEGTATISSVSGKESASCIINVVKYGFRNATIFDTETSDRFHLLLATARKQHTDGMENASGALLILDLRLPDDSTNITSGHYPLLSEGGSTPGFFAGKRENGKITGSYLVDKASNDTFPISSGQFSVSIPEKYFILGELNTATDKFSFFYEGAIPQKTTYSTVTDLAKFLGWSTSQPFTTAIW